VSHSSFENFRSPTRPSDDCRQQIRQLEEAIYEARAEKATIAELSRTGKSEEALDSKLKDRANRESKDDT